MGNKAKAIIAAFAGATSQDVIFRGTKRGWEMNASLATIPLKFRPGGMHILSYSIDCEPSSGTGWVVGQRRLQEGNDGKLVQPLSHPEPAA